MHAGWLWCDALLNENENINKNTRMLIEGVSYCYEK